MPIDLNMLLGLPPANPRAISPLSAAMLTPGNDIGQIGPSSPRMGPDSEDYIGEVGPVPEHLRNWTGGSVQGMPITENIGEVGPPGAVSTPKSDMAEFGPLTSTPKSARLPMPLGFDELAQKRGQTGTDGAAGQAKPEDAQAAGDSVTPALAAAVPPAKPKVDLAKLQLKKAIATELAEKGTPTQRIRGKLALYEVEKQFKKIEEGEDEAKQLQTIAEAPVDDDAKKRMRTAMHIARDFKGQAGAILEASGLDDKGVARAKEREQKLSAFRDARSTDDLNSSKLKMASQRALNIIQTMPATTGFLGGYTQDIYGTPAYKLKEALAPIKAIIGFDRLQQMRDQSKTGGALGSIAVKELEFLQAVQGSLEIGQDPQTIKENVLAILKAQQIFANMRKLVPGLEAGDRESIEAYAALSGQLGTLDEDVSRMLRGQEKLNARKLPPSQGKGAEIDARYGVK